MEEDRAQSAAAVLNILRKWEWRRCDPDGTPFRPGKALQLVVNMLAMEEIRRPQDAILTMLCQGVLIAHGKYLWQKYQDLEKFRRESYDDIINPLHWQKLYNNIVKFNANACAIYLRSKELKLEELQIEKCLPYKWDFTNSSISYALFTSDLGPWDTDYIEEWFSAWDIDIVPGDLPPLGWDDPVESVRETAPTVPTANKGGRPPAADWELAALEISGRYYRGDFKPETIADVGRALTSWLGNQDLHPSDSVVRTHAKRIFDAFQAWEHE